MHREVHPNSHCLEGHLWPASDSGSSESWQGGMQVSSLTSLQRRRVKTRMCKVMHAGPESFYPLSVEDQIPEHAASRRRNATRERLRLLIGDLGMMGYLHGGMNPWRVGSQTSEAGHSCLLTFTGQKRASQSCGSRQRQASQVMHASGKFFIGGNWKCNGKQAKHS